MQDNRDLGNRRRGRVAPKQPQAVGKRRIEVELDEDVVDHFLQLAEPSGGAAEFHKLINAALRELIDRRHAAAGRTVNLPKGKTLGAASLRELLEEDPG